MQGRFGPPSAVHRLHERRLSRSGPNRIISRDRMQRLVPRTLKPLEITQSDRGALAYRSPESWEIFNRVYEKRWKGRREIRPESRFSTPVGSYGFRAVFVRTVTPIANLPAKNNGAVRSSWSAGRKKYRTTTKKVRFVGVHVRGPYPPTTVRGGGSSFGYGRRAIRGDFQLARERGSSQVFLSYGLVDLDHLGDRSVLSYGHPRSRGRPSTHRTSLTPSSSIHADDRLKRGHLHVTGRADGLVDAPGAVIFATPTKSGAASFSDPGNRTLLLNTIRSAKPLPPWTPFLSDFPPRVS